MWGGVYCLARVATCDSVFIRSIFPGVERVPLMAWMEDQSRETFKPIHRSAIWLVPFCC